MTSKELVEIVFHGRGGQGAVTAANLLVAAALKDGNKGVQAFPFFGAERRGAPVRAFAAETKSDLSCSGLLIFLMSSPNLAIISR